jgi:rRNA pseudouridine-1189 N-methylase Emg1 (Nep1/Mra1 family)
MITVVAKKYNGEQNFEEIIITKDNVKFVLDEKESEMLLETLKGKKGVVSTLKKGEYQAEKVTLFSCDKPMNLVSYDDEK